MALGLEIIFSNFSPLLSTDSLDDIYDVLQGQYIYKSAKIILVKLPLLFIQYQFRQWI
jgi:hypothetical protein